ncbi:MAG: hypothetical protein V3V16_11210 [Melioribacteraceae bacterium]
MSNLSDQDQNKLSENIENEDNSTSIRELKNEKDRKITWKGSEGDLIKFLDQLYNQQLLTIKSYDEIFTILSHYFVDEDGKQIRMEKSAAANLNLHGAKMPKGYSRYMSVIDRLKVD